MTDETFKVSVAAIQRRIEHINSAHAAESSQARASGLVSMGRVTRVLALRFIQRQDWPGHTVSEIVTSTWALKWYFDYCQAIAEVSRAIQEAVRNKHLTIRSPLTRTVLDEKTINAWLGMDLVAQQDEHLKILFQRDEEKEGGFRGWPDSPHTPGAAYVQDVADWAAAEGLGTVDEIVNVLTVEPEKMAEETTLSMHSQLVDWKTHARSIADECFDRDTNNNCRDNLNGYAKRVLDLMRERGVKGPRGYLENSATVKRDALQGPLWWQAKAK